jgi:hypothetical protein
VIKAKIAEQMNSLKLDPNKRKIQKQQVIRLESKE